VGLKQNKFKITIGQDIDTDEYLLSIHLGTKDEEEAEERADEIQDLFNKMDSEFKMEKNLKN
jgi:hypothetical protein